MAAKRYRDAPLLSERKIVALAHVVEAEELDHHVVGGVAAGLDESETVMALIDVHEVTAERTQPVVAQPKAEDPLVERHDPVDVVHMQHHMAHAERAGAETRDVAARHERLGGGFRAMKEFEPVAGWIVQDHQILHMALGRERMRSAGELDPGRLEPGC